MTIPKTHYAQKARETAEMIVMEQYPNRNNPLLTKDAIELALLAARNEGLELAAKECDAHSTEQKRISDCPVTAARRLAIKIRALKGTK
ncbi:MAG: hypothetical protein V4568_14550 [Pseudomonadota bacterium]